MNIIKAEIEHVDLLIPLFDAYRVFYRASPDPDRARQFLNSRIANKESIIYLAIIDDKAVGFTHLYFSFSSVSMQRTYIINDLYVHKVYRKQGIGEALLNRAKQLCRDNGYKGVGLETEPNNPAQFLYERLNWEKDHHLQYFWMNDQLT